MQDSLFNSNLDIQPLAARMRPKKLTDYIGQQHILGPEMPLRKAIENGSVHSMILWGPPGVGKTTLAKLIAEYTDANFIELSAVLSGVKDIREVVERAKTNLAMGKQTVLFIDEVHRFNKSQQDAFLPFIEDGTFTFIGATTENPSFELNSALLSRARVYVLKSFDASDVKELISRSINEDKYLKQQISNLSLVIEDRTLNILAQAANGDGRTALNLLEILIELARVEGITKHSDESNDQTKEQSKSIGVSDELLNQVVQQNIKRFDKGGDVFYEQISALHKSVRGSSVDGALYWFARMIDGGCDPLYVARRVVRMASEDIGNADPRALQLSLNAWEVQERLGSPEGELAIAQAIVYLASAPKSNAVYKAWNKVQAFVKSTADSEVPVHLRNAPTKLMKELGYGKEYRYAHDEPDAYAAGEVYLPEEAIQALLVENDLEGDFEGQPDLNNYTGQGAFYQPENRGLEAKIKAKLEYLLELDQNSNNKG